MSTGPTISGRVTKRAHECKGCVAKTSSQATCFAHNCFIGSMY